METLKQLKELIKNAPEDATYHSDSERVYYKFKANARELVYRFVDVTMPFLIVALFASLAFCFFALFYSELNK